MQAEIQRRSAALAAWHNDDSMEGPAPAAAPEVAVASAHASVAGAGDLIAPAPFAPLARATSTFEADDDSMGSGDASGFAPIVYREAAMPASVVAAQQAARLLTQGALRGRAAAAAGESSRPATSLPATGTGALAGAQSSPPVSAPAAAASAAAALLPRDVRVEACPVAFDYEARRTWVRAHPGVTAAQIVAAVEAHARRLCVPESPPAAVELLLGSGAEGGAAEEGPSSMALRLSFTPPGGRAALFWMVRVYDEGGRRLLIDVTRERGDVLASGAEFALLARVLRRLRPDPVSGASPVAASPVASVVATVVRAAAAVVAALPLL